MNNDIYRTLLALSQQPSQPQMPTMQSLQQQNPFGFAQGMSNLSQANRGSQPQYQQPSWLDVLNQTLMSGHMMPQQMPFNQYAGNMMGYGQQQPQTGWQRGLTGAGTFFSGISNPLTSAGTAAFAVPGLQAAAPFAAAGGVLSGGLGNLLQYLGQPGAPA